MESWTLADLIFPAVAQGIIAQMRVLGGSIGIAASTAILGVTQGKELSGIVTQEQLANLRAAAETFTKEQLHAVRQTYSDAFNEDMRVCAIIAGVCILATLGTFKRNTQPILERRKEQLIAEQMRLRGLKSRSRASKRIEDATSPA